MPTSWPTLTVDDILSGKGAKSTGRDLFDQQQALKAGRRSGFPFLTTTFNFGVGTWGTAGGTERRVHMWPYLVTGESIVCQVRFFAAATNAISLRLAQGATKGAIVSTSSTSPVTAKLTLAVNPAWSSTYLLLKIEGRIDSGTGVGSVHGENLFFNLYVED